LTILFTHSDSLPTVYNLSSWFKVCHQCEHGGQEPLWSDRLTGMSCHISQPT